MSIINEALKKTEELLQKNTVKDNSLPFKPPGNNSFLLYVLILLAGLGLSNFIFNLLNHQPEGHSLASSRQTQAKNQRIKNTKTPDKNTPPVSQATNSPPASALPIQTPEENKPAQTSFILNGIFFSNNDGYALVNNQIVRKNDYVDGAKVGSITANAVQLDNAGQIITLTTR